MGKEVDKNVFIVSVLGIVAVFGILAYMNADVTAMASKKVLPEYTSLQRDLSCVNNKAFVNEFGADSDVLKAFCKCKEAHPNNLQECRTNAKSAMEGTAMAGRVVPLEGRDELYYLCKKAWGGDIGTCSILKDTSFDITGLEKCVEARKRNLVETQNGELAKSQRKVQVNERAFAECAIELELAERISAFQNA